MSVDYVVRPHGDECFGIDDAALAESRRYNLAILKVLPTHKRKNLTLANRMHSFACL